MTYYNLEAPSQTELRYQHKEKTLDFKKDMVSQYGVSPAVLECLERDWDKVSVYQICKEVLSNHNLTKDEARRLSDKMKELDR